MSEIIPLKTEPTNTPALKPIVSGGVRLGTPCFSSWALPTGWRRPTPSTSCARSHSTRTLQGGVGHPRRIASCHREAGRAFRGLNDASLKRILRTRFNELKKEREQALRGGVAVDTLPVTGRIIWCSTMLVAFARYWPI